MTVKELRDKLTSFIESDKRNGDVQVWFNDDECNLLQVEKEEVQMVRPLDILGKYGDIPIGEIICCLNTRVDDDHDEMHIRGTEVVTSDTFEKNNEQAQRALERIGQHMAEHVYWRSGTGEKMGKLEGAMFTNEIRNIIQVYRKQFQEAAKEDFETNGVLKLRKNFTSEQIKIIERAATDLPPLRLKLSGEELNPMKPRTMCVNGIIVTDYANA
jgi:hypothetical protein